MSAFGGKADILSTNHDVCIKAAGTGTYDGFGQLERSVPLQAQYPAPFRAVLLLLSSRSNATCESTVPNQAVLAREELWDFF